MSNPFHPGPPFMPPPPGSQPPQGPPPPRPMQGPNFSYLLPPGWSVGEEGPFALVLRSPDMLAAIVVFGQSGLMAALSPEQFAHQAMAGVMRIAPDVRLFESRPFQPLPGYTHAAVMQTTYTLQTPMGPVPIQGVVFSHVAIGYGTCSGVITLAASAAHLWPSYRDWLPQVALAARNMGSNAYGSTAMGQTMHDITQREGQANADYRAWSQSNWQGVVNERWASDAQRQEALGPMLTGQQWSSDPYGNPDMRRSTTPACIWVSRDGREVHSHDPSFDPRTPYDSDWRRVR
ncbi:hypothetical protein [Paludisphaera rhizosphaerae]|uniref:hypothetical protein n=1 Tax=Paludisphaera rhizosphaerae TaxID=2711216 RepID=UPI0013EA22CD|nr:hypothetical protein [Paludisphaera rhizosphaerae]